MILKSSRTQSFTLIELMAVMTVLVVLAGLMVGVAGYAQKKMGISSTRAQIVAISAALEMYKADWGFYPPTFPERISSSGVKESSNNAALYYALSPMDSIGFSNDLTALPVTNLAYTIVRQGRKVYMRFPASQIRTNTWTQLANIYDTWGKPLVYYNSPRTAFAFGSVGGSQNTGYLRGGQVNLTTYDLFSYGPDGYTYLFVNALPTGWTGAPWINTNSANDDIWSSGR